MLVSLIDTLDIRAILLSNHYGPKLSSNFNYRKKILTTQKLYNYTFLVPLSHPVAYFGPLLRGGTIPVLSLHFGSMLNLKVTKSFTTMLSRKGQPSTQWDLNQQFLNTNEVL